MIILTTADTPSEFRFYLINLNGRSDYYCLFNTYCALQNHPKNLKIAFQAISSIEHSVKRQRSTAASPLTRRSCDF